MSITLKYLILLNSLPGIRWNLNEGLEQAPIHFVFDGGAGLLMKRRPGYEDLKVTADEEVTA